MIMRRPHATFLYPPDAPTEGAAWEKQSYREHIKGWNQQVVGDGSAMPGVLYVFVVVKCCAWMALFWYNIQDESEPFFGEQNFKRFLLYNILGDVLGTNATSGPLGMRLKFFFVTWCACIALLKGHCGDLRYRSVAAQLQPDLRVRRTPVCWHYSVPTTYFPTAVLR